MMARRDNVTNLYEYNEMTLKSIDCEQSRFSSRIRREERKTRKRASITVSVTCERRCRKPLVAWTMEDRVEVSIDVTCQFNVASNSKSLYETIVNRGKWLGKPVNIKAANKQAEIYVGRPLTRPWHIFCVKLIDSA